MVNKRFLGFLHLSIAHHPLCWHFRNHTIRINNLHLCLGCTGFYSGFIIGFLIILFSSINQLAWEFLIFIGLVLYIPTILRLLNLPFFNSSRKDLRIFFRLLLGLGVTIGLVSIFKAPNYLLSGIQILLGIGLYFGIGIKRALSKDLWMECEECTFSPSPYCPGFIPFKLREEKVKEPQ